MCRILPGSATMLLNQEWESNAVEVVSTATAQAGSDHVLSLANILTIKIGSSSCHPAGGPMRAAHSFSRCLPLQAHDNQAAELAARKRVHSLCDCFPLYPTSQVV